MNRFTCTLTLAFFLSCQFAWSGQALSQQAAVALAETFVAENGYTNAAQEGIKPKLDLESIEWTDSRVKRLEQRHNTIKPKAIGAKKGRRGDKQGWSIAFDYASQAGAESCRVVTMDSDGSNIRIEHVDGKRVAFAGFN